MPICKKCGSITEKKSNNVKYCNECAYINQLEINRKCKRKYHEKYKKLNYYKNWKKEKPIKCKKCGELKRLGGHNLCRRCYSNWLYLVNKLKNMSDSEKQSYLVKHNLLNKELTIVDLKKDLGVI